MQTQETRALITQLIELLGHDWNKSEATTEVKSDLADNSIPQDLEEDPIKILASRLHSKANALDQSQFVFSTQLEVEESETYNKAMQGPHASQWSQAMKEKLDSLYQKNTWTLIPKGEMEPGHRPLGENGYTK